MKILHTSDWHLGRQFHAEPLTESFQAWADFVVETVEREGIDVLLIAGDVYDRALPPVSAVQLLSRTLSAVVDLGASVVISSGNHDSAGRLGFGADLLRAGRVYIGADVERIAEPVRICGADGVEADFYPVPYLDTTTLSTARPSWLIQALGEAPVDDEAVHRAAMDHLRATAGSSGVPSVVLAHVFAAGGVESDSEREIRQGGLGSVPKPVFSEFAYVALGHLHRRQRLEGNMWYSGSPLPFSFSEEGYAKGGVVVDLSADGSVSTRTVDFTGFRPVKRLKGGLEEILGDPELSRWEDAFVAVELTDAQRPADPLSRLRERFPRTLQLSFSGLELQPSGSYGERMSKLATRTEVAESFFQFVRQRELSEAERAAVENAVESVRAEEFQA